MTELKDLSEDQRCVVTSWGKGLAVLAGAGSGKTTTLVIKCEELLKRDPRAKFAAVSFTERSASDLRAKLSERLAPQGGGDFGGNWVMTIHGLCGAIIREYPREAGFDGEESVLAESEARLLWERAIESLWFGKLPEEAARALELLLARESRDSVIQLLSRTRDLAAFGAIEFLLGSQDKASQALGALTRYVLDRYERMKKRRGAMDFGDLESGADRALEHAHVREAFHRRFELVLVDEFQDTNPLQARIILKFVRPDVSNLCVVGDPKQSIYRFRDADVSVFEEFCEKLPQKQSLSWNFRSRPQIIEWTNTVCEKAFAASGMRYEPLEAKRERQAEGEAVVRLDLQNPAELGAWIRGEVARGVPLHEMALLVRRIRGNEKWFKALAAAGIPLAMGSGGLFWEDPRVRECVAFLKWWENPANNLSGAVFLRAPWVGIPDGDLDHWLKEDPTWERPFFASAQPLAHALASYRGKIIRPGELLMALLISEEIEREIGSACLGLWHRVEDLSSRGLDFHAVVLELSRAVEEARRERDVPPPKSQGQLSVLTFHASKGLEFPHVILVDLGKKPRANPAPLLFWDRHQGAYLTGRDSDGERDDEDPRLGEWKALEKERNLAESKRIFYVAATRARERLILVCPELPPKIQEAGFDPEKAFHEDDWRAWVECGGVALPPAPKATGAATQDTIVRSGRYSEALAPAAGNSRLVRSVRPRHSVTEWNLLSRCPRAYEWTYIRPRIVTPDEEAEGASFDESQGKRSGAGVSSRELGTRVHAALELGDWDALREIEREIGSERFRAEPLIRWVSESPLMARPAPGASQSPHSDPAPRAIWTELAFEVPVDGEILVGSIDRLIQEPSGKFRLVDFKITARPKSSEELLESYRTQMALYAWALRTLELGGEDEVFPGLEAVLVNISPTQVSEISVPGIAGSSGGDEAELAKRLAALAAGIVNGEAGRPRPGKICRYCVFQKSCPAQASTAD